MLKIRGVMKRKPLFYAICFILIVCAAALAAPSMAAAQTKTATVGVVSAQSGPSPFMV
jgi:uncharacterized protein YraI